MKHLRVVACMIMLALAGCDNNDKTAPTTKSEAPAVAQPSPAQDPAQLQKLAQQSQGKALTLLDASEAQLDGAATLVLTFSIPLDPEQDFSRVVHVVDKKSGSVDGAWELAPNLKELRLRHLEPERVLVVTVDPAVKYSAANYLIQICILFDTTGIQTTANYLIPNSPSFDSF